jgi:hypothetical protein
MPEFDEEEQRLRLSVGVDGSSLTTMGLLYDGLEVVTFGDMWAGLGEAVKRGLGGYPLEPAEFGGMPNSTSSWCSWSGMFRVGKLFTRSLRSWISKTPDTSPRISYPGVVFPLIPFKVSCEYGDADDRGSR